MKRILLSGYGMLIASFVMAQVSLQPAIPAVGMLQKSQLWNILVVNNTPGTYDCRLELVLRDRETGQEVLTATTAQFSLSTGARQLNVTTLDPIRYNHLTGMDGKLQGLLPAGTYTACYALTATNGGNKETSLAEECLSFDVEPLSPPMLLLPADSAELEIAPTQFSWTPPTPDGMFDQLQYEVLITEINEGQKASEALQENLPFYTATASYNMLVYPTTATSFKKEKWYAWQVIARNGLNYAAKTEVWTFKVRPASWVKQVIEQTPFVKMKQENPEKAIAPNGILKLAYTNETADTIARVQLVALQPGREHVKPVFFDLKIDRGENLLQKDISALIPSKENTIYEARIINSRNEMWRMLFEVREYKDKKAEGNE